MKIILTTLTAIAIYFSSSAQTIKIFSENKQGGAIIYATNTELYPISVQMNFDITNMLFSEEDKTVFVIPAKTEKFKIGELTAAPAQKYKWSYKYKSALGDVTIEDIDDEYSYDLPFPKGKAYKLFRGYNGSLSHKAENALDFTMPEGSEIVAAREGIIVQLVQNNSESCPREECKKYNNYITVMHSDGTFSQYAHIKYNGATRKLGDAVKKGDVIAYSGNVGYSSGPHLHFVCFKAGFEKWQTLKTKFKIGNGESGMLQEGETYTRSY